LSTDKNLKEDVQDVTSSVDKENGFKNKVSNDTNSSKHAESSKNHSNSENKYDVILQKYNKYKESDVVYREEDIKKLYDPIESKWCLTDTCMKAQLDEAVATLRVEEIKQFLEEINTLSSELAERANDIEKIANETQALLNKYSSEADAARRLKETEIAEAVRNNNSSSHIGTFINTYPKQNDCPRDNLRYSFYGGYVCQDTSYVGWKVYEKYHIEIKGWGNSNTWDDYARAARFRVDDIPEASSVAVSNSGYYGHVMWVESVNPNNTINISEYNNSYSSVSGKAGDFGYRSAVPITGLKFIHFTE
jgi:surface antigen